MKRAALKRAALKRAAMRSAEPEERSVAKEWKLDERSEWSVEKRRRRRRRRRVWRRGGGEGGETASFWLLADAGAAKMTPELPKRSRK